MFLSRRYRPNKWPFYVLIALEAPLTIALLALFGIAAPDLYRTKLWQDGAENGFNSNPNAALYAAANYKPYTAPRVWSQLYVLHHWSCRRAPLTLLSITDYNVVISVLSMFLMLLKSIMYICHVFPPILSAITHAGLIAIYTVSVIYQTGSDTTDPAHPQHGAPWYITKSCSVAHDKGLIGYCTQAKASFACTVAMLSVFVGYFGFAVWSCFPSKAHQEEYAQKKRLYEERYGHLDKTSLKDDEYDMVPATPFTPGMPRVPQGELNPATPRTLAFNRLGGISELPLRKHFSSPNAPKSPTFAHALRSPDIPRSPLSPGFAQAAAKADEQMSQPHQEMYFPPPPKESGKK